MVRGLRGLRPFLGRSKLVVDVDVEDVEDIEDVEANAKDSDCTWQTQC